MKESILLHLVDLTLQRPRLFSIVFMIVLPFSLTIFYVFDTTINFYFEELTQQTIPISRIIQILVSGIVIPFFLSMNMAPMIFVFSKKYEEKREIRHMINIKKIIIEYEFLRKIFYVLLPMLLLINIYDMIVYGTIFTTYNEELPFMLKLDLGLGGGLALGIFVPLTIVLFSSFSKEFYFRYAKYLFQMIDFKSMTSAERMKYLILILESYNKYLNKRTKLQINKINEITYLIIKYSPKNMDSSMAELAQTFEENDRLSPLRYLSNITKGYIDEFLVKKSLNEKIKEWSPLIIALFSTSVAVVNFIQPYFH